MLAEAMRNYYSTDQATPGPFVAELGARWRVPNSITGNRPIRIVAEQQIPSKSCGWRRAPQLQGSRARARLVRSLAFSEGRKARATTRREQECDPPQEKMDRVLRAGTGKTRAGGMKPYLTKLRYILLLRSPNVVYQLKQRPHHDTVSFPNPEEVRRTMGDVRGRPTIDSFSEWSTEVQARRRLATSRPQAGPVGCARGWGRGERWGWKLRFSSGGLPRVGRKGEKDQRSHRSFEGCGKEPETRSTRCCGSSREDSGGRLLRSNANPNRSVPGPSRTS